MFERYSEPVIKVAPLDDWWRSLGKQAWQVLGKKSNLSYHKYPRNMLLYLPCSTCFWSQRCYNSNRCTVLFLSPPHTLFAQHMMMMNITLSWAWDQVVVIIVLRYIRRQQWQNSDQVIIQFWRLGDKKWQNSAKASNLQPLEMHQHTTSRGYARAVCVSFHDSTRHKKEEQRKQRQHHCHERR